VAYFGSVLRTEDARGEAITCLLVALFRRISYLDYAKKRKGDFGSALKVLSLETKRGSDVIIYRKETNTIETVKTHVLQYIVIEMQKILKAFIIFK